jgi:putative phage-type endonuclease
MTTQQIIQPDRVTYLGGSDVAAILGISPWRTPLDVYLDKIDGSKPITDPGKLKILERGKRLEPYVLDMLCEEKGIRLIGRNNRYTHGEHSFLAAEIDAETDDGRNVEAKTTADFYSRGQWGDEHTDEIPVYYTAQCMHGMMIKPAPSCLMPVMLGIDDFRVYEVKRDDELIETIRAKEVEFWDRIQRRDPPPATKVSDIMRLFERDQGTSIEVGEDIAELVKKLKFTKSKLKLMESDVDDMAARLKLVFMEHQIITHQGKQLASWKSQANSNFDINAFRDKHPAIAEKFTKRGTQRVLRIK